MTALVALGREFYPIAIAVITVFFSGIVTGVLFAEHLDYWKRDS